MTSGKFTKYHVKAVWKNFLLCIRDYKRSIVVVVTLCFWSPLPITFPSRRTCCAYSLLVTYSLWLLGMSSSFLVGALPLVMLPLLKVTDTAVVCHNYLRHHNALRYAALAGSIAMENSKLHKRITFRMLRACKPDPRMYMLSLQGCTLILSIIGSPVNALTLLIPLVESVMEDANYSLKEEPETSKETGDKETHPSRRLSEEKLRLKSLPSTTKPSIDPASWEEKVQYETSEPLSDTDLAMSVTSLQAQKITHALMTSISFTLPLSSIFCLYSSTPLWLMYEYAMMLYDVYSTLTIVNWVLFILPIVLLAMIFTWLWTQVFFFGFKITFFRHELKSILTDQLNNKIRERILSLNATLGPLTSPEIVCLTLVFVKFFLWLTLHDFGLYIGWHYFFSSVRIEPAVPALFVSLIFHIIPFWTEGWWKRLQDEKFDEVPPQLVTGKQVHDKMTKGFSPYSLQTGAAFALMDAVVSSGLYHYLIDVLKAPVQEVPKFALCFLVSVVATAFSSFMNATIATLIFLPATFVLAAACDVNPLYFVIPATVMVNGSFGILNLYGVATLLFGKTTWSLRQMIVTGIAETAFCCFVMLICHFTIGTFLFKLDEMPDWYYDRYPTPNI